MSLRIVQLATAEGAEHENTTTENTIARKIFKANELSAGKVYNFHCGVIVNDNNSTDTLTLAVRFGTTSATPASNTSLAASSAVDSEDADQAVVWGSIHVQTTTRAIALVYMQAPDAKGTGAVTAHMTVLTIAADTTYYLDVTADWSVAHADNEVAAACFTVLEAA
jgi:hypothetical protein